MQVTKTYLFFVSAMAVLLSSCRKDVTLELPDYQNKIVVDGFIETGSTAAVFLSNSVPYFGTFDFSQPQTAFIKNAEVTVTDGTKTEKLIEVDPSVGYFYVGTTLVGVQGKTYTLTVKVGDIIVSTSTTLLPPAKLDSLYFVPNNGDLGFMGQRFTEPEGSGDCYRWFAKRLGKDNFYGAPFNSVFDDKFIDGQSFDFVYNRGTINNQFESGVQDNNRGYFKIGDTVVVKLCKIGKSRIRFLVYVLSKQVQQWQSFQRSRKRKKYVCRL